MVSSCSGASESDRGIGPGSDGTGGGGSDGGGIQLDSSIGVNLDGAPGIDGSTPDSGGEVEEPPPPDCMTNADCCPQIEGCTDASEYICTVNNKCGKIKDTCTTQEECQSDTYCCLADCRKDGEEGGVCIPNNVPPGLPCEREVSVGVFAPSTQCEWTGPAPGDPAPNSRYVFTTPLVADLPVDSGESAEIVVVTADTKDPELSSKAAEGVIRILSGQDCSLLSSIESIAAAPIRANGTPALADLDGDGDIDIVARRKDAGLIAYKWEGTGYEIMWNEDSGGVTGTQQDWGGPSIHDLDNDGKPEVLLRETVYNGQTGTILAASAETAGNPYAFNGSFPVVGDLDGDGKPELVSGKADLINYFGWTGTNSGPGSWEAEYTEMYVGLAKLGERAAHFGIADFDSDGNAEIVAVSASQGDSFEGRVAVYKLDGTELWHVDTAPEEGGGPPTIGDFDGDGQPEIGVAGATRYRVFDFDCAGGGPDCEGPYVRWSQPSQDYSSKQTGSSVFDFDGDNEAEVVYADECFLRVYKGTTGEVLFSAYRTSGTWLENPVIADVDKDQNTEIVVNSAYAVACPVAGDPGTPYVDPLHSGVRCENDEGCLPGSSCVAGFCRCTGNDQCCRAGQTPEQCGLTCQPPPAASDDVPNPPSPADGNVCRATHPNSENSVGGIRVLRDGLDRWASSRPMWNQHAYSITNINDDGSIPSGDWRNWSDSNQMSTAFNNYRQNTQGRAGFEDLPDITGRFTDDQPCVRGASGKVFVQATVCNRGKRTVGAALPASFFQGDTRLCTSYTDGPVPTGGCKLVYCEITGDVIGKEISLIVNHDETGAQSTLECRPDNNTSTTTVEGCPIDPIK